MKVDWGEGRFRSTFDRAVWSEPLLFYLRPCPDSTRGRVSVCLGRKKGAVMSSPKTRRSSPNAKKGIRTTKNTTVNDKNPFHDPPVKAAMLSAKDLPRNMPTTVSSTILKQARRSVYTNDFSNVGKMSGASRYWSANLSSWPTSMTLARAQALMKFNPNCV